jgi:hypothetical protein
VEATVSEQWTTGKNAFGLDVSSDTPSAPGFALGRFLDDGDRGRVRWR